MVKGKYVIGWEDDDFVIYRDGCVAWEGDTIVHVGRDFTGDVDEVIDAGDAIIAPGFIDMNAVGDIDHHLIFSDYPAEHASRLGWSADYFEHRRREDMSTEDEAIKSRYVYAHMLRNGTTTAIPITSTIPKAAGETYEEIVAAAGHAADLGLRVYLGPSYLQAKHVNDKSGTCSVRKLPPNEIEKGLANAERFIQEFDGAHEGLIRACVGPERIELQSEESILASVGLARKYGVPIRMHATQGLFEYGYIMDKTGLSPVQYLERLGYWGKDTLLPHGFVVSGYSGIEDKGTADLDILRDRGVGVIHCPIVIGRSGKALQSWGKHVRHGIRLCLGSDTWPADIIENIKYGSMIARILDDNREENHFATFYRAATVGAARALGRGDLGRLAPGCQADIIVIDQTRPDYGVQMDPIQSLFNNGYGSMVRHTIVAGRIVMRDRVIPGFDDDEMRARAQEVHDRMRDTYIRRSDTPEMPAGDFFPPNFPLR